MADPAKAEQEQSMEEILQSIKRIIAEEGDPASPQPAAAAPFGSDVLELTDAVEEAAPIDPIDAIMAMSPSPPAAPATAPVDPIDAIMAMTPPAPTPVPDVELSPMPTIEPAPAAVPQVDIDALMADTTVAASAAALQSLMNTDAPAPARTVASAAFRSGQTVEDLVIESLRPMLKEWLDGNLPQLVERLVQREIDRIRR